MILTIAEFKGLLNSIKVIMHENKDFLIELDSAMGDGDLGLTMTSGFDAAAASLNGFAGEDIGAALFQAGMAMNNAAASTMGTLVASAIIRAAKVAKGVTRVDEDTYLAMAAASIEGIMDRGKAKVGDKTILDALVPAVDALKKAIKEEGQSLASACESAYQAAQSGFESTKGMVSQHGRAHYYGEKSRGKYDPGAAVAVLVSKAIYLNLKS
jgi:dihydroxyacetone kinase-like protein